MAIITRLVPHYTQPQEAVRVDPNNPLTRGLKNAFGSGTFGYDAVTGILKPVTAAVGTISRVVTPRGVGLNTPNGGIAKLDLNEDWSGASTILFTSIINSIDSPWGGVFAKNTSASGTSQQLALGRQDATDDFYFGREDTATTQLTSTSITSSIGATHTIVLTNASASASATIAFYLDGSLIQSTASSAVAQNTGAGSLYLGSERSINATYDSDVTWLNFYRWNRVLSAAEIAEVSRNPWQIFQPRKRQIYVSVAGATARTSTTSLTAAIRQARTATASASAAILQARSANASLSSAVQVNRTATAGIDSALLRAVTVQAGLNAALKQLRTVTTGTDAAIRRALSASASLDSAIKAARTATAGMDGYVLGGSMAVASLSAAIKTSRTALASVDAAIRTARTASTGLSAGVLERKTAVAALNAYIFAGKLAVASINAAIVERKTMTAALNAYVLAGALLTAPRQMFSNTQTSSRSNKQTARRP